jgi:hypothetical protein
MHKQSPHSHPHPRNALLGFFCGKFPLLLLLLAELSDDEGDDEDCELSSGSEASACEHKCPDQFHRSSWRAQD